MTSPLHYERPVITAGTAMATLRAFGRTGTLRELPGERDRNFLVTGADGERTVLKFAHADESAAQLDLQHRMLERIATRDPDVRVPRVLRSSTGRELETAAGADGRTHLTRLLTFVPGTMWAEVRPQSPELRRSLGQLLARIDAALHGFAHPAAHRELKWDLARATWIGGHLAAIADPQRRDLVRRHLAHFERQVLPAWPRLRQGVIHNDANEWNIVCGPPRPHGRQAVGLIDFGDALHTAIVAELAIGAAYATLGANDPLAAAADVVAGYHATWPLTEAEAELVWPLLCMRLSVSVVNAAGQHAAAGNPYLAVSEAPAWTALQRLAAVPDAIAVATLRHAAGLDPHPPGTRLAAALHRQRADPSRLIDDPRPGTRIDLSVGSTLLPTPAAATGPVPPDLVDRVLGRDHAFAITAHGDVDLRGRACPGIRVFAPAGTRVLAPRDGVVTQVTAAGVWLRHGVEDAEVHAFYGGLQANHAIGRALAAGAALGTIAPRSEGNAPHLLVQITDTEELARTRPDWVPASQRVAAAALFPDPTILTGMAPANPARGDAILRRRRDHLGPSLSISYRQPLTIVRGFRQFLWDEDGRQFLDCVNNVPHVGHCHPRVVAAAQAQMAVLNTNTRYLHDHLATFAERLVARLPAPLRVCWFVNSGSEANELAIRLARAATGARGMVVVDVGYHGNTTTLIDVSPYKHDGPGGTGAPPWVQKIPMPDPYRGVFRGSDPAHGPRYAAAIDHAIARLQAHGERPAAFLAESILSCGGQIVPPPGFLAEAARRVRAHGGVYIADEVQTGLGRPGRTFWAFELQDVVPDIVTIGKPIGNGHPLGAVVTTPAIAQAFANGMEYFNTFGGNPVSCATGLAVLDVIEQEGLQANARAVGDHLLRGLRELVARHAIVGDARGEGLFVGIELVRDRATLAPADTEASYVANRLRDRGLLLSTDGPYHNVLKIKPPLCFTRADADRLVAELDQVLGEDLPAAQP